MNRKLSSLHAGSLEITREDSPIFRIGHNFQTKISLAQIICLKKIKIEVFVNFGNFQFYIGLAWEANVAQGSHS